MRNKDKKILEKLLCAFGPSNDVGDVHALYARQLSPYVDDIKIDAVGNLFAFLNGNSKKENVMFFGHADTVGFQIAHIVDGGFIYAKDITGLDAVRSNNLPGQRVIFKNRHTGKYVKGLFANPVSIHQENMDDSEEERNSMIDFQPIDAGFSSPAEAYKHINDADYGVFEPHPEFIKSEKGLLIRSAGLDNRISLYAMLEIARKANEIPKLKRPNLILHSTISEETSNEIGMSGGMAFRPDVAVYIDVTTSSDSITVDNDDNIRIKYGKSVLNAGPVLSRGQGVTEKIFKNLEHHCRTRPKIPYQIEQGLAATENVAMVRLGIPSALISVPCRYLHTNHETVAVNDVSTTVKLAMKFFRNYNGKSL